MTMMSLEGVHRAARALAVRMRAMPNLEPAAAAVAQRLAAARPQAILKVTHRAAAAAAPATAAGELPR